MSSRGPDDERRATVSNLFDGVHNQRIVAVYVPHRA